MNNDFVFGLIIAILIVIVMLMWTGIVYLNATIKRLKAKLERFKKRIYELVDSNTECNNQ